MRKVVKTVEINAIKLENTDDLKKAEKALLNSLIKMEKTLLSGSKPAYFDGIISRNINRKISLRISKYLASTGITPNQISIISFLISAIGSSLFLLNNHITTLIGGLLIQFSSIVDGCDGEIARLKFMESKYGAWLDGILDRYADFIIVFCMTMSVLEMNPVFWAAIGLFAALATFMIPYTGDKYVVAYKETYVDRGFFIPMTRDVRMFLVMLGAIFNSLGAALIILAVLGNLESIRRVIALRSS